MLASESSPCLLHSCSSWFMQLQLKERRERWPKGQQFLLPQAGPWSRGAPGLPSRPCSHPSEITAGPKAAPDITQHHHHSNPLSDTHCLAHLAASALHRKEELDQKLKQLCQELPQDPAPRLPVARTGLVWHRLMQHGLAKGSQCCESAADTASTHLHR